MRMAPLVRVNLSRETFKTLDKYIASDGNCEKSALYISQLKNNERKAIKTARTWPPGRIMFAKVGHSLMTLTPFSHFLNYKSGDQNT